MFLLWILFIAPAYHCTKRSDPIFPQASFIYTINNLTVDFTNESVDANRYEWDFGDGNTSTEESPTHTYTKEGEYIVVLTAFRDDGKEDTSSLTLILPDEINTEALFSYTINSLFTVDFTNKSVDANKYEWDFGDGNTSTEESPTHTYTKEGEYIVVLTAFRDDGKEDTSSLTLILPDEINTEALFSYTINSLFTVDFTNKSVDANKYEWDFGDGNTSTEESPTHTYTKEGEYIVVLTAFGDEGEEDTFRQIFELSCTDSRKTYAINWDARPEKLVNQEGGGYRICYGISQDFTTRDSHCTNIDYEDPGPKTPTSTTLVIKSCYQYIKIYAFSSLNTNGGRVVSVKLPE